MMMFNKEIDVPKFSLSLSSYPPFPGVLCIILPQIQISNLLRKKIEYWKDVYWGPKSVNKLEDICYSVYWRINTQK